jgi:hypothetical protein
VISHAPKFFSNYLKSDSLLTGLCIVQKASLLISESLAMDIKKSDSLTQHLLVASSPFFCKFFCDFDPNQNSRCTPRRRLPMAAGRPCQPEMVISVSSIQYEVQGLVLQFLYSARRRWPRPRASHCWGAAPVGASTPGAALLSTSTRSPLPCTNHSSQY